MGNTTAVQDRTGFLLCERCCVITTCGDEIDYCSFCGHHGTWFYKGTPISAVWVDMLMDVPLEDYAQMHFASRAELERWQKGPEGMRVAHG